MSLVATLISNPRTRALDPKLVSRAAVAIGCAGPDWLSDGIACDFACPPDAKADLTAAYLREAAGAAPIDVIVQEAHGRRKALLVADMDSTMIDQECIDELAAEAGLKEHVAAITARAMNGEIAFEPALRERVALLKGLPAEVIRQVIAARISIAAGARELVATMNREGARTVLVSGGFTAFTGPIAAMIGFQHHLANTLLVADGRLTGEVAEPILGREAKAETLREQARHLGIDVVDAIAVGDGANDLAMLRIAGTGVAMHAKPIVSAEARFRIDHGDLTALLYLQGYRQRDFAS